MKLTRTKAVVKLLNFIMSVSGIVCLFILWELSVRYTQLSVVMPSPGKVIDRFFLSFVEPIGNYTLWQHALFSFQRVIIGYLSAAVCGTTLGIVMGRSQVANAIVRPLFELIRPIPGIAWIPMAILWFGIGENAKFFIIFMSGFSYMLLNTYAGASRVDNELVGVARMLGASNRHIFLYVVLPSCVPYVFAGLQISISTCWMAVLAAEMVSSTRGLGWIIVAGMESLNTTIIFVGIICIALLGLLFAAILRGVERKLCVWRIRGK